MVSHKIQQRVSDVCKKQRKFFLAGHTRELSFRVAALQRLENSIVKHRDDILDALTADLAKPNVEAYVAEYHFLLEEIRLMKKSLKQWMKPRKVSSPFYMQPCSSELRREPYGVTLIMAPWNYPIQLALSPLIAAVSAGNTVVLKPSEMSPVSEALITEIVVDVFPPEQVVVMTGGKEVADALLDYKFDFIFFTGSTVIGKIVAQKAAVNLAPCVLELGGKCPALVDKTADLKVAAIRILTGKFFNGGQTCFAPDFIAVHESVYDDLLTEIQQVMDDVMWYGEMAHVINIQHFNRLEKLLQKGQPVIQQGEDDAESLVLAPRVVTGVSWNDEIMMEEIFGPILPVVTYRSDAELVTRLQGYGSPLALYLFSKDEVFIEKMLSAIRSGGVCINDTMKQGAHLKLPFGGVGESGYGRYRGEAGVNAFSYERAVVRRPLWSPDIFDPRPPYGDKIKWMKRFLK